MALRWLIPHIPVNNIRLRPCIACRIRAAFAGHSLDRQHELWSGLAEQKLPLVT
jgi:hypothetical protein